MNKANNILNGIINILLKLLSQMCSRIYNSVGLMCVMLLFLINCFFSDNRFVQMQEPFLLHFFGKSVASRLREVVIAI